jgi:hypothetical protein
MGEKRVAFKIIAGKFEGKVLLGRQRYISEGNIKIDVIEI